MAEFDEKIERITIDMWLKSHPGKTVDDYYRERSAQNAREQNVQQLLQQAEDRRRTGCIALWFLFALILITVSPILGVATTLIVPGTKFSSATQGWAIIVALLCIGWRLKVRFFG